MKERPRQPGKPVAAPPSPAAVLQADGTTSRAGRSKAAISPAVRSPSSFSVARSAGMSTRQTSARPAGIAATAPPISSPLTAFAAGPLPDAPALASMAKRPRRARPSRRRSGQTAARPGRRSEDDRIALPRPLRERRRRIGDRGPARAPGAPADTDARDAGPPDTARPGQIAEQADAIRRAPRVGDAGALGPIVRNAGQERPPRPEPRPRGRRTAGARRDSPLPPGGTPPEARTPPGPAPVRAARRALPPHREPPAGPSHREP